LLALLHATGAEKRNVSGKIGKQFDCALERSQPTLRLNAGRTR